MGIGLQMQILEMGFLVRVEFGRILGCRDRLSTINI